MNIKKLNRRNWIKLSITSAFSLPILLRSKNLFAEAACPAKAPEGKKLLDPTSKAAKRLKYVADGSKAEKKKTPTDNCGNCKFYTLKKETGGYAPCKMLANKYVTTCGWCKSHKPMKKKKA